MMKQVYIKNRKEWREWLAGHHDTEEKGIWLVFYKKHTKKDTLEYDEAVEEALCYGWIDSVIKRIDDEAYVRKFTPRKLGSQWSLVNQKRVEKLIKAKKMTRHGMVFVEYAKKEGVWGKDHREGLYDTVPEGLEKALAKNKKAKAFFDGLAPSYRKQFMGWIQAAKRQETIDKRVKESIGLLSQGKKLGMK